MKKAQSGLKIKLVSFKFDENLVFQAIPLSSLEPSIVVDVEIVSWDEFVELGDKEMCLRAHIKPVSDHSAKLAIMLIPESLRELNELTYVAGLVPIFAVVSRELVISPVQRQDWNGDSLL